MHHSRTSISQINKCDKNDFFDISNIKEFKN